MNHTARSIAIYVWLLAICLSAASATTASAQQPAPAAQSAEQLVNKLPANLREQGRALLDEKNDGKRADLAETLAEDHPAAAMEFLVALLENDPSVAVRRTIINELSGNPHPLLRQSLTRLAASDRDVGIALLALDKLRVQQMQELNRLLARRMELARQSNDQATWRALTEEQERWIALTRGTMLPAFLRASPPVFSLKAADQTIRVVTLGDFGYGSPGNRKLAGENQQQVARAMLEAHRQRSFDFGLTLGDNFYPDGMESLSDTRWQTLWRDLYEPLGLKFYATLGNHDWRHADSPAAEILYSQQSSSWRLPSPYYTYTAGPAQFFALDTNEVSEAQLLWLDEALTQSRARWKVVYGHHPIYSAGQHGDAQRLIARLLPMLKDRADVYFAGHDHDLQHLKPEGGVHFFINGGGGAGIRKIEMGPRSLFAQSAYGFATLEADAKKLTIKFFGTDLKTLYEYALTKADGAANTGSKE